MKNFLIKLLSIKYNLLKNIKQSFNIQNEKQKEKENKPSALDHIQHTNSLSIPNEQLFENLISPVNQSAVQVIYSNESYKTGPCCRRKPKTINRNDVIHHPPSLPLIKQCSEEHESFETFEVPFHAVKDDRQKKSISDKNISNNSISSTKDKQPSSSLSSDTEPNTEELYNEMNIRELVNTVRTEIGALIDADRNNQKEEISLSTNETTSVPLNQSVNHNFYRNNQNINLSAVKKKSKKKSKKKRKSPGKKKKRKSPAKKKKRKSPVKKRKSSARKKKRISPIKKKKRKSPIRKKKNSKKNKSSKSKRNKTKMKTKSKSKKRVKKTKKKKHRAKKSKLKSKSESPINQSNNCCCNFLHYSLRQVVRDTEQMKQFALNTSMIGLNPSKLIDPTNTLCPAICIPMYNCENLRDQRFPFGPTFTSISKNDLNEVNDRSKSNRMNSMIIQTINTQRGQIQIKLDPQSFGLAPFFSEQYETFIKGPPNSIFFTNYINTYHQ